MNVDGLRGDAVDVRIRHIDWSEHPTVDLVDVKDGDHAFTWQAFETFVCDKCGEAIVLSVGSGDDEHSNLDPDAVLPACTLGGHHGNNGPCDDCQDSTGDDGVGVCMCEDAPCDGHIPRFEGPMMNAFFPCPFRDAQEAAKQIAHLPLCVVEFSDGETGFALTGGGMDFSWEICAAYVACGFLPPAEFRLPKMGGITLSGWHLEVYEAMRETFAVRKRQTEYALTDLDELKSWLQEHNKPRTG